MSSAPIVDSADPPVQADTSPAWRVLRSVLALLAEHGVPYCILHGYAEFPAGLTSDVDCVVGREFLPRHLAALLEANRARIGTAVVQYLQHESTAHYFVLAADKAAPPTRYLSLDVSSDYRRNGRVFYHGEDILASRREYRGLWVPSPAIEFGCYLVKKVAKRDLREVHGRRLTELYRLDPTGCDREIGRFWRGEGLRRLAIAARSGEWADVQGALPWLRNRLLRPRTMLDLLDSGRYWVADAARRIRRWRQPTGLHVVLLGADGSGKSTVIAALRDTLAPAFRRVVSLHWAPSLVGRARAGYPVLAPHSRPPRSAVVSLAAAARWLMLYVVGYGVRIRPALARSTLVLFDRYFVDALVDPARYRYGGPRWLLRFVWWINPKPDVVILLDAPAELVQARKHEVALSESERQRRDYRKVVESLPNGHVVDGARPLDQVVTAAADVVLEVLRSRTARRLQCRHRASTMAESPPLLREGTG